MAKVALDNGAAFAINTAMRISDLTEGFQPTINATTVMAPKPSIGGVDMFAGAYFPDRQVAWLEVVSVSDRRQGAGTAIVEWFEGWAKDHGATEVRAEALTNSLPFWRKIGYQIAKEPTAKNRWHIRKKI